MMYISTMLVLRNPLANEYQFSQIDRTSSCSLISFTWHFHIQHPNSACLTARTALKKLLGYKNKGLHVNKAQFSGHYFISYINNLPAPWSYHLPLATFSLYTVQPLPVAFGRGKQPSHHPLIESLQWSSVAAAAAAAVLIQKPAHHHSKAFLFETGPLDDFSQTRLKVLSATASALQNI